MASLAAGAFVGTSRRPFAYAPLLVLGSACYIPATMVARIPSARVLALLSQKGGSGKTTLATHLAVALGQNRRVVLVDTDPQSSAAAWAKTRETDTPELVEAEAGEIGTTLRDIRAAGANLIIIDSMPSVASDVTSVARQADLVLIPCRPSILDLRAVGGTVALVKQQARVEALIVRNAVASRHGAGEATATHQARQALAQYGLPIAEMTIGYRVDLAHALAWGLSVEEFAPQSKATAEIRALADLVESHLWQSAAPALQSSI
jgi:chromosome partitioning protein